MASSDGNMSAATLERTVNSSTSMATILPPLDCLELVSASSTTKLYISPGQSCEKLDSSLTRKRGTCFMERSLRPTLINIPLQSIASAGTNAVDQIDGNAWCQTSSSTTIQALIVPDELAETVVLPLPSSR